MADQNNRYQNAVYRLALDVFDSEADAQQFMIQPHALLESQTPLLTSITEEGAKRVMEILERLRWGLPR